MTHRRAPLWKREKAKAYLPQDAPGRRAGDVLPATAEARVNRPRAASELPAGPGERRRRLEAVTARIHASTISAPYSAAVLAR